MLFVPQKQNMLKGSYRPECKCVYSAVNKINNMKYKRFY